MNKPIDSVAGERPTEAAALAVLLDTFLPGSSAGWPSASKAIGSHDLVLAQLDRETIDAVVSWAANLPRLTREERHKFLENRKIEEPRSFENFQIKLYQIYYAAEAVQERISAIAAAGPREPSPFANPNLVIDVMIKGRGKRRL